jgi:hypothetical protein
VDPAVREAPVVVPVVQAEQTPQHQLLHPRQPNKRPQSEGSKLLQPTQINPPAHRDRQAHPASRPLQAQAAVAAAQAARAVAPEQQLDAVAEDSRYRGVHAQSRSEKVSTTSRCSQRF